VTGGWRKLHNDLRNFYSPLHIIRMSLSRRMRWVGHVARMEEMRHVNRIFVGKSEGTTPNS
jgi:hypothetical protein